MKKIYKHFSIFVLFIAIVAVVSGCGRKNEPIADKPATEKSSEIGEAEKATSSSEVAETATSTAGTDTSDWKTYRNNALKFRVNYPTFLQLSDDSAMENNQYMFWFTSPIDKTWDVQFSTTYIGDRTLSLDEKYKKFIKIFSRDHNFKEFKIDNGYIFYSITWTKGGYSPGALIFSDDSILFASLEVYDEKDNNLTKYDRYIEDFLKILKTSKFYKN